jgi:hypothetical protein
MPPWPAGHHAAMQTLRQGHGEAGRQHARIQGLRAMRLFQREKGRRRLGGLEEQGVRGRRQMKSDRERANLRCSFFPHQSSSCRIRFSVRCRISDSSFGTEGLFHLQRIFYGPRFHYYPIYCCEPRQNFSGRQQQTFQTHRRGRKSRSGANEPQAEPWRSSQQKSAGSSFSSG